MASKTVASGEMHQTVVPFWLRISLIVPIGFIAESYHAQSTKTGKNNRAGGAQGSSSARLNPHGIRADLEFQCPRICSSSRRDARQPPNVSTLGRTREMVGQSRRDS